MLLFGCFTPIGRRLPWLLLYWRVDVMLPCSWHPVFGGATLLLPLSCGSCAALLVS